MDKFNGIDVLLEDKAKIQKLVKVLQKDPVRNSSIIGFAENNPITKILSEGESFLVKGTSDREWIYFASKDKEEFKNLLGGSDTTDTNFASLEDWMIPEVIEEKVADWRLTTMRYYLPPERTTRNNRIDIKLLHTEDAAYINANSNYKQFLPVEYLKRRINQSFSAGVIENDKLVAWAITHDDGAIGALHVLDEFRQKGYAAEIVTHLCKQIRETERIPIAQIEEKNTPAIKLFDKLGFMKDRRVTWLVLKE